MTAHPDRVKAVSDNMKPLAPAVIAWQFVLSACLYFGFGRLGVAQDSDRTPPRKDNEKWISVQEPRDRAIARCRENRGVNCDTPEGQKEWINQDRPITDEERARAAAARRAREAPKRY